MMAYLGCVWSDGDPFVLADRGLAQDWEPQADDYGRLVATAPARRDIEIPIGNGLGVLLGHEADEGPLDVFRVDDRDLLALIFSYADEPDPHPMAERAASASPDTIATLRVHGEQIVLLRTAVPWSEANVVAEQPGPYLRTAGAQAGIDALVVALPHGEYAVGRVRVDEDRYGFDAWRIRQR